MNRITKAQLENSLSVLNDTLGFPQEPYARERDANGRLVTNAGTFVLDWAYGGVAVCRMCAGGGQSTVSGRGTMREAYTYISAILAGIRYAHEDRIEGLEAAFCEGFNEGRDGTWVEGDPAPAWRESDTLAEMKG